jgi:hypothetical protein
MLDRLFELAGGTTVGRDHLFSRKPNQDSYCFVGRDDLLVGIVCDGCGDPTSPYSEVGSRLGTRLLTSNLLGVPRIDRDWLDIVRRHAIEAIQTMAAEMCGVDFGQGSAGSCRPKTHQMVRDYFLFTVVGFAITPEKSWFFSIGDGTLWVNGEQIKIGPFENNAPPYMSYALMDSSLLTSDPGCLKFQIRKELPTEQLESFLIGSDGVLDLVSAETQLHPNGKDYVGNISQFWTNDAYFTNSDQVNRKLTMVNKGHSRMIYDPVNPHYIREVEVTRGHLHDDTTLIVGRRKYAGTASVEGG